MADTKPVIVLVIEDDQGMRGMLSRLISREFPGCNLLVAVDNKPATVAAALGGKSPDLILTDFNLGTGITGIDWLKEMRAGKIAGIGQDTKVILMSGGGDRGEAGNQAQKLGIPFIGKPFNLDELRAMIKQVLSPGSGISDGSSPGPAAPSPAPDGPTKS